MQRLLASKKSYVAEVGGEALLPDLNLAGDLLKASGEKWMLLRTFRK